MWEAIIRNKKLLLDLYYLLEFSHKLDKEVAGALIAQISDSTGVVLDSLIRIGDEHTVHGTEDLGTPNSTDTRAGQVIPYHTHPTTNKELIVPPSGEDTMNLIYNYMRNDIDRTMVLSREGLYFTQLTERFKKQVQAILKKDKKAILSWKQRFINAVNDTRACVYETPGNMDKFLQKMSAIGITIEFRAWDFLFSQWFCCY